MKKTKPEIVGKMLYSESVFGHEFVLVQKILEHWGQWVCTKGVFSLPFLDTAIPKCVPECGTSWNTPVNSYSITEHVWCPNNYWL